MSKPNFVSIHPVDVEIFHRIWDNYDLLVVPDTNVRLSPQSVQFILWGPLILIQNFMAIHPVVVEIFQSGKLWPDPQTVITIPRAMLLTWLKITQLNNH